jgi:hypothetical protein
MTTATTNTRVRHDSDANFREWVQEIHDQFVAIGLTQTADTGQADLATITRPAQGLTTHYEIWEFADALQATAPIFLRVEYGTQSGVTSALWRIGIGTGTDGAGNLTATGINGTTPATVAQVNYSQGGSPNNDTLRQSDFCHAEGFFGVSWKNVSTSFGLPGIFAICRTCDADGAPDGRGFLAVWDRGDSSNPVTQAVRFAPPAFGYARAGSTNANLGFMPQAPASSAVGSDVQIARAWTFCEGAEPLFGLCGVYPAQQALQSTFSVALVGSTARTYKVIDNFRFGHPTAMRTAMLWE